MKNVLECSRMLRRGAHPAEGFLAEGFVSTMVWRLERRRWIWCGWVVGCVWGGQRRENDGQTALEKAPRTTGHTMSTLL